MGSVAVWGTTQWVLVVVAVIVVIVLIGVRSKRKGG